MSTPAFQLPSFAKINWSLRVLGRRPDGYHEVLTVLQTISLQDDLRFTAHPGPKILLSCNDSSIPLGEDNLIIRAANGLRERCHVSAGATIHLEKRIPMKGGLGGASSNAAVTLRGLVRLWSLDTTLPDLAAIAGKLGADVPFFLTGGRMLAAGIGTELETLADGVEKHLVLVTPNAAVSTAAAYESLQAPALTTLSDASILSSFRAQAVSEDSQLWARQNDFERVIFSLEPEIARAKAALIRVGSSCSLMAGSGSSVFGIFDNREEQERAVNEIQAEVGWRVFPAVTVSRRVYQETLSSWGVPRSGSEQSET